MHRQSIDSSRVATLVGGSSLIAATLVFSAVFVYLARSFGYPEVLDLPAAEALPRLLALGPSGRAVWVLYGLIPLLLIPTAMGVYAAGRRAAPLLARAAVIMAVLSALTMMAGLLRWPSLHWQLALAYSDASPGAAQAWCEIAKVLASSEDLADRQLSQSIVNYARWLPGVRYKPQEPQAQRELQGMERGRVGARESTRVATAKAPQRTVPETDRGR